MFLSFSFLGARAGLHLVILLKGLIRRVDGEITRFNDIVDSSLDLGFR